jgi:zinc D-Ala-D-Ala carboxypeptidase
MLPTSALEFPGFAERWPNFSLDEMRCKHTGMVMIVPEFMDRLQALRRALDFPLPITSGYRSQSHPVERAKPKPGAHTTGRAVDIAVTGERAFRLVEAAPRFGFTGIGISQRSGHARFIHLDDVLEFHAPRPAIWSY